MNSALTVQKTFVAIIFVLAFWLPFTVRAQQETKTQAALISELRDKNSPEAVRLAAASALGSLQLSPEETNGVIAEVAEETK